MVLAIVHDIPHVDEEGGFRMAPGGTLRQLFPIAVITGLGIWENQALKGPFSRRTQGVPLTCRPIPCHAVFIVRICLKFLQFCPVLVILHPVIGEKILLGRNPFEIFLPLAAVFDDGIFQDILGLPHDGPAMGRICRDQLPQKLLIHLPGQAAHTVGRLAVQGTLGEIHAACQHGQSPQAAHDKSSPVHILLHKFPLPVRLSCRKIFFIPDFPACCLLRTPSRQTSS